MLPLTDVLTADQVGELRSVLAAAPFNDGRATASLETRRVKSNTQADQTDPAVQQAAATVRAALERSEVVRSYARPQRWTGFLFSRYVVGDRYGNHLDDPVMFWGGPGGRGRFRSDLSFTVFLSDPATYDGGELVIEDRLGSHQIKLPAGGVFLYPAHHVHRVNPVTRGERLACVGWVQSMVRRDDQRNVLFDLANVRSSIPAGDAALLFDRSLGALVRMWVEP